MPAAALDCLGEVALDGLNVVLAMHTPGPMAAGNWTAALYLDERPSPAQQEALGAIFGGAAGGPPRVLATPISDQHPPKVVPIDHASEGKRRRVRIADILDAEVEAVPGGGNPDELVGKRNAHSLFPELGQAYGVRSRSTDHSMRWDNAGKNGDYAPVRWANT